MTYGTPAVELQKNQVFASVVDWVLSEISVRLGIGPDSRHQKREAEPPVI